jgi:hypothetical protein
MQVGSQLTLGSDELQQVRVKPPATPSISRPDRFRRVSLWREIFFWSCFFMVFSLRKAAAGSGPEPRVHGVEWRPIYTSLSPFVHPLLAEKRAEAAAGAWRSLDPFVPQSMRGLSNP